MIYKALKAVSPYNDTHTTCYFVNMFTKKEFNQILEVTMQEINDYLSSTCIQSAMPKLSASERELFLTGMNQEEWDELSNEEDDDE